MILELTADEQELLMAVVQRELDEIGPEIRHTWARSYRDDLKTRRLALKRLSDRLQVAQVVGTAGRPA